MRENRIIPASGNAEAAADPRAPLVLDRRAALVATLERGVAALLTSEDFRAYLRMQARFHAYSFGNVLLIQSQRPDATLVNSYRRWQALGRQVRTGEKGIAIFVPHKRAETDPETGEPVERVTGFGVGTVFDVSQTEGDPLPTPPPIGEDISSSGIARAVNLRLSGWLIGEGLRLESKDFPGNASGFYHPTKRQIVVRRSVVEDGDGTAHPLVDPLNVQKTKTLVHEAAHYVADHRGTVERRDAETVAEGAAFVVMAHHGLDTAGYSFPYLATWAQDVAVLKRNLTAIQQTAAVLIGAIERTPPEDPSAAAIAAAEPVPASPDR
jgi:antirestriction protein ArdC